MLAYIGNDTLRIYIFFLTIGLQVLMADSSNTQHFQKFTLQWKQFLQQNEKGLNQQVRKQASQSHKGKQHSPKHISAISNKQPKERNNIQLEKLNKDVSKQLELFFDKICSLPDLAKPNGFQNSLDVDQRYVIDSKNLQIKQKDQRIAELKKNEIALNNQIEAQKCQLGKKKQKIQLLTGKLRQFRQQLTLIKKKMGQITQLLGKAKQERIKSNTFQQKFGRFAADKQVECNLKLRKQKQAFAQQTQRIFSELELSQRDACRMIGISLDSQLSFQQKSKQFYKEIQRFILYQTSFNDSQIIQQLQDKQWLLSQVTQCIGRKQLKTRLIFKLDQYNKTNFHKYIDKKYNILLLVKLDNGLVIGGFCHTPIEKDRVEKHKNGFLFSLSPNVKYPPKSQNQALVSYDDFFLIFGNSEIRIKTLQTKVFSNFGTNSGAFFANGKKAGDFLGGNSNQEPLKHYQIYQISDMG